MGVFVRRHGSEEVVDRVLDNAVLQHLVMQMRGVNPCGNAHGPDFLAALDAPPLTDKEIITMDWLCDNVDGAIPDTWELKDSIKKTVKASGVKEKA